jgi:hypothetical protein
MANIGWIKIYRQIMDHWVFANDKYFKAWITIIMTVNHEPAKVLIQGELIQCNRGQSLMSLQNWSKKFGKGWTIQRVRTFFALLEKDEMIEIEGLRKTTRLTVCKYDSYQDKQHTNNTQTTHKQHTSNTQVTTNKNNKNKNNEKNECITAIFDDEQYSMNLQASFPKLDYKAEMNKCYDYHILTPNRPEHIWQWRQKLLSWLQNVKQPTTTTKPNPGKIQ